MNKCKVTTFLHLYKHPALRHVTRGKEHAIVSSVTEFNQEFVGIMWDSCVKLA